MRLAVLFFLSLLYFVLVHLVSLLNEKLNLSSRIQGMYVRCVEKNPLIYFVSLRCLFN